jgi:hypothetical protein
MKTSLRTVSLLAVSFLVAGQITPLHASRPASACQNVFAEGSGPIELIQVAPGIFTLGFAPAPVTFGNVPGMMSSIVTGVSTSGANGQGAQHITLRHTFVSTDPARPGTFTTEDRAVCAPAGSDPNVCQVNDVLTIVGGTDTFANAAGSLRNHGVLNLNPNTFSLTYSIRGRMCGDGL